jgi:hypothetical protein
MALFTTDEPCALPVAKSTLVGKQGVFPDVGVFFQAVHADSLLSCGVRMLLVDNKKSRLQLLSGGSPL